MTTFVTLIILGLLWGGVYLLAAEGLNLIYGVMKVVNLAHGDFIVFGGLLAFSLYGFIGINPLLSFPVTAIVLLAIGAAVQFGILERIGLDRGDAELRTLLATFGLSYVVANTSFLLWGSQFQSIPFLQSALVVGPVAVPEGLLVCSLIAFGVAMLVHLWLTRTITGKSVRRARSTVASMLQPLSSPSRPMSVNSRLATPASSNRRAMSTIETSETSAQPSVATMPSRASTATTIPPGNSHAMSLTNSGSLSAAVPITTRATPRSNQPSTAARLRMPPPSWT